VTDPDLASGGSKKEAADYVTKFEHFYETAVFMRLRATSPDESF